MAATLMMFCFMSAAFAQNLQMTLGESWNGTTWENAYQSINTYDAGDDLVTTLSQVWTTPPGQWENGIRYTYTNNPNGAATEILIEVWDGDTSEWMMSQRVTNTLNGADQVLTATTEMWIGTGWINFIKQTHTYGGGFLTSSLSQTWDFMASAWANSTLTTYTNNPDGSVNQSVSQTWNPVGSVWDNSSRSTYTYNGAGDALTELEEMWTGSAWQNDSRTTNTYDGEWLAETLTEVWAVSTSTWQNDTLSMYTNNANGTPAQIVVQNWNTGEDTWSLGAGVWVNAARITFTYEALGLDDLTKKSVAIYPNPAREFITVKLAEQNLKDYSITDQHGRTVQVGALSDFESSVDISGLASGIYFFQFGESRQVTVKLIKQ